MKDNYGREINYLRISITDRCNLRCNYCMPEEGVENIPHNLILSYEELLKIVKCGVKLGITRYKITGGEPLIRKGCVDFIGELKKIPGVEQVTMTTNGILLDQYLEKLVDYGLDGVNISLDTLDSSQYSAITGRNFSPNQVLSVLERCSSLLPTKVNVVLLQETENQVIPLGKLVEKYPVDVRFIQKMPLGQEITHYQDRILQRLEEHWTDLHPVAQKKGNGPAVYFQGKGMVGYLGLIRAIHSNFCEGCNRIRLTSTGGLKSCLCHSNQVELAPLCKDNSWETAIKEGIIQGIMQKPQEHSFRYGVAESNKMNQLGG